LHSRYPAASVGIILPENHLFTAVVDRPKLSAISFCVISLLYFNRLSLNVRMLVMAVAILEIALQKQQYQPYAKRILVTECQSKRPTDAFQQKNGKQEINPHKNGNNQNDY